jgi:uncharacterized protein YegP (UPF0339 family)
MKFKLFKDRKREWRWKLVAANKNTLADSGEGYRRKVDCVKAIKSIQQSCADAEVETVK